MRQHIHKVEDNDVQRVVEHLVETVENLLAIVGVENLVVAVLDVFAVAFEVFAQELLLELVLAAGVTLVKPVGGVFLGDNRRHQAGEQGVAGVMRGRGQDAVAHTLVLDVIVVVNQRVDAAPLVIAEIVDDEQEGALLVAELREQLLLQHRVRLQGLVVGAAVDPVEVVALHEFGELHVGLLLLRGEHLGNALVFDFFDLQLPVNQVLVKGRPLLDIHPVGDAHGELAERLLIVAGHLLAHKLLVVDILLQAEQYLVGVHRFDEVVGDIGADGVLHDVLLFALGNHHDGKMRVVLLEALEGLQAAQSGHILIQKDDVHKLFLQDFEGFHTAHRGNHVIALGLQEQYMRFQQVNLVVRP